MPSNETVYIELGPDGRPGRTSQGAAEWLDEQRRERIRKEVASLEQNGDARLECRIDGASVRIAELQGKDERKYLAAIDPLGAFSSETVRETLTERQFEVAELAANGATAREIGATLDISPNTVKHHLKNIYQRLGIGSRVELADRMRDE